MLSVELGSFKKKLNLITYLFSLTNISVPVRNYTN